jgi:3-deoxy-manno-octulosonate cytidylyltransferase (CMP-KDO synthetase)
VERNPLVVLSIVDDDEGPVESDTRDKIVSTWRNAIKSRIGSIVVDTNDDELREQLGSSDAYFLRPHSDRDEIRHNYMTLSGAERLARHVNKFDRFYNHDVVINVYGHLEIFSEAMIRSLMWPLADYSIDIAVVVEEWNDASQNDENIGVSVEWEERRHIHHLVGCQVGRPTQFSYDPGELENSPALRLLPVFAYKRASLDRFLRFGPSLRELEETLEPLRAFDMGMRVGAVRLMDGDE